MQLAFKARLRLSMNLLSEQWGSGRPAVGTSYSVQYSNNSDGGDRLLVLVKLSIPPSRTSQLIWRAPSSRRKGLAFSYRCHLGLGRICREPYAWGEPWHVGVGCLRDNKHICQHFWHGLAPPAQWKGLKLSQQHCYCVVSQDGAGIVPMKSVFPFVTSGFRHRIGCFPGRFPNTMIQVPWRRNRYQRPRLPCTLL